MQQNTDAPIEWAGFRISANAAESPFLIVGAPGSGKPLTLHSLMTSVLHQIHAGADRRAVIFDSRGETLEFLKVTGVPCPVHYLNPFATDGAGWDIGADWTDTAMAHDYAALLIPERSGISGSADFFTSATRAILQGVLTALILRSQSWTFHDLIAAINSAENLRSTLESAPATATIYKKYGGSTSTFQNILSTLQIVMGSIHEIDAASKLHPQQQRMRLGEWIRSSDSILVVGRDSTRDSASARFNSLVFNTLSLQALSGAVSPRRRNTSFFLDDVQEFQGASGLPRLLADGRGYGVHIAITCNAVERLNDIYGTPVGLEMASMCANCSILRVDSAATADWASRLTSGAKTFEYQSEGTVKADFSNVVKDSKFLRRRPACTASDYLGFPPVVGGRVWGCHMSPAFPGPIVRETLYPT